MKPFDLEKALAGAKVITREGGEVLNVRYYPNSEANLQIIADVKDFETPIYPHTYYADGRFWDSGESSFDLFMADDDPDEQETERPATATQVGGSHYKDMAIQPIEFILKNGLGFCEGNVIKYICRHRSKYGKQDLEKAMHYLQLLIEKEYGK